jgi:hypothetical protein
MNWPRHRHRGLPKPWTGLALRAHVHSAVFQFLFRFSNEVRTKFTLSLNLFQMGSNLIFE